MPKRQLRRSAGVWPWVQKWRLVESQDSSGFWRSVGDYPEGGEGEQEGAEFLRILRRVEGHDGLQNLPHGLHLAGDAEFDLVRRNGSWAGQVDLASR